MIHSVPWGHSTATLIYSGCFLFHLLWLGLPVWVPGLLDEAAGLVADVPLLGPVLLAALLVLWCPVLPSVNRLA